jgi:hypothetical protein
MVCIDITPLSFLTIFFSHTTLILQSIFFVNGKKPFHINPPFGGIFVNEENPFQNNTPFGGIFVDEKKTFTDKYSFWWYFCHRIWSRGFQTCKLERM